MILFLILALVALIISMWAHLENSNVGTIELALHCFAIIMVFCAIGVYCSSPIAIDVYRGKTTLEITYKDTIPIDSVVVFKNH